MYPYTLAASASLTLQLKRQRMCGLGSWLGKNGVPTTNDSAKYVPGSVPKATVRAIMTMDGFVQSTEGAAGPLGIFLAGAFTRSR